MVSLLDRVLKSREEDLLGRTQLATSIVGILEDSSDSEGLSIAIFGSWGSGKSTVANWAVDSLPDKGWVKIYIPAWQLQTVSDFWARLGYDLFLALDDRKMLSGFEGSPVGKQLRKKAEQARNFIKGNSYAKEDDNLGGIFSATEAMSAISENTVKKYIACFNEKPLRIVVTIDDMDRMDPKALPHVLLGMQEVFQEKGICFLVPVDRDIAKGAIEEYSEAWREVGELFLEKVFDLQFSLNDPSKYEKLKMLEVLQRKTFGSPVVDFVSDELSEILPSEPRRIKSIATILDQVRDAIEDHGYSELCPNVLILAAASKARSHVGFHELARRVENAASLEEHPDKEWMLGALVELTDSNSNEMIASSSEGAVAERLAFMLQKDAIIWQKSILVISGQTFVSRKTFLRILEDIAEDSTLNEIGDLYAAGMATLALCIELAEHIIDLVEINPHQPEEQSWAILRVSGLIIGEGKFAGSARTEHCRVKLHKAMFNFLTQSADESSMSLEIMRELGNSVRNSWKEIFEYLSSSGGRTSHEFLELVDGLPGAFEGLVEAFFSELLLAWGVRGEVQTVLESGGAEIVAYIGSEESDNFFPKSRAKMLAEKIVASESVESVSVKRKVRQMFEENGLLEKRSK